MAELKTENQYEVLLERIEEYEEKHYPVYLPTLPEVIRLRMAEMGLSQKALAELLGVSPSRISEYMTRKAESTLKVARLLNQKLDIDADFILG